jgi:hypothetical protein
MVLARGAGVVATLLVACVVTGTLTSCRKKPTLEGDAGADAAADASRGAGPTASTTPSAAPVASVPTPVPTASPFALTVESFSGNFTCPKGPLKLVQAGTIVTSTVHTNATTDTVVACKVAREVCTGSVREIQTIRGKSPKVLHLKNITLERTPSGDMLLKGPDPREKPALCRKR